MAQAAARNLEIASPNGEKRPVRILVGAPRRSRHQGWYCPIRMKGIFDGERRFFGADSWQALTFALRFVELELRSEVRRGMRLYHYGEKISVNQLFATDIPK